MALVVFPSTLPGPSLVSIAPLERRLASDLPGVQQIRGVQRDYCARQQLEWNLLDAAAAAALDTWWRVSLTYGGAWFAATWPHPTGWSSVVRRFLGAPKWQHLPGGFWRVSGELEVRGRGLPPTLADPISLLSTDTFSYLSTTVGDTTDYSTTSFDDSGWLTGPGPFSDQDFLSHTTDFPAPGTTTGAARVWIRKRFVRAPALPINVLTRIDNLGGVWINGLPVSLTPSGGYAESIGSLTPAYGSVLFAATALNTGTFPSAGNPVFIGLKATQ